MIMETNMELTWHALQWNKLSIVVCFNVQLLFLNASSTLFWPHSWFKVRGNVYIEAIECIPTTRCLEFRVGQGSEYRGVLLVCMEQNWLLEKHSECGVVHAWYRGVQNRKFNCSYIFWSAGIYSKRRSINQRKSMDKKITVFSKYKVLLEQVWLTKKFMPDVYFSVAKIFLFPCLK